MNPNGFRHFEGKRANAVLIKREDYCNSDRKNNSEKPKRARLYSYVYTHKHKGSRGGKEITEHDKRCCQSVLPFSLSPSISLSRSEVFIANILDVVVVPITACPSLTPHRPQASWFLSLPPSSCLCVCSSLSFSLYLALCLFFFCV